MTNPRASWSEDHVAILKAGWPDPSVTISKIADAVDRSNEAVATRGARLGLGPKAVAHPSEWTDEKETSLRALWDEGLSNTDIGIRLGFSRGAISGKVDRLGLTKRGGVNGTTATLNRSAAAGKRKAHKPALRINAGNQVVVEPEPRLPRVVVSMAAFLAPLAGSTPRPFSERPLSGCKWPLGDGEGMLACCVQAVRGGYCDEHAARAFAPPKPGTPRTANELARSLRRYVSR